MVSNRVLFVDDEQNILQGLRRMLRSMRNEWDMAFVHERSRGSGSDGRAAF